MKKQPSRAARRLYAGFMLRPARHGRLVTVKPLPREALDIGKIVAIEYETTRGGAANVYRHRFKVESRPLLVVSSDGKQLILIGGSYRFTRRGIVDL